MDILQPKKSDLFFHIALAFFILTGIVSVVSFVLYVLARMHEEEQKEKRYQSIHYLSLFIFVVLGVFILIMVSNMNL